MEKKNERDIVWTAPKAMRVPMPKTPEEQEAFMRRHCPEFFRPKPAFYAPECGPAIPAEVWRARGY